MQVSRSTENSTTDLGEGGWWKGELTCTMVGSKNNLQGHTQTGGGGQPLDAASCNEVIRWSRVRKSRSFKI